MERSAVGAGKCKAYEIGEMYSKPKLKLMLEGYINLI
jgi:hypothetical protein